MSVERICGPKGSTDILSDILQDLRLAHASYGRSEFTAPFGVEVPFEDGVRFHFVAEGNCWLLTDVHEPIMLGAGDIALLPHGTSQ